ncbi:MAG TPA: DUF58 domain-containing protein, partial [Planctomycetia bacterium]|nr:DUF58 domain-containing protein [Planctomycetia bacterium]
VNLLILAFSLMVVPALLGLWFARRALRRLSARRLMPEEAYAATPFEMRFEIKNTRRIRGVFGATLEDRIEPATPGIDATLPLPTIAAGTAFRGGYRLTLPARGRYRFGPISLRSRFPFGIFEWKKTTPGTEELLVFPAMGTLTPTWRDRFGRALEASRRPHPFAEHSQDEVHGLREYRQGDNPRHIHWRTTARRGTPVVKEFETLSARDAVLLVDLFLGKKPTAKARDALERGLRFAATFTAEWCVRSRGNLVVAVAGPTARTVHGPANARLLRETLRILAQAEPTAEEHWRTALRSIGPNQCVNAQVVAIAARPLPDFEAAFRERFGRVRALECLVLDASDPEIERHYIDAKL